MMGRWSGLMVLAERQAHTVAYLPTEAPRPEEGGTTMTGKICLPVDLEDAKL